VVPGRTSLYPQLPLLPDTVLTRVLDLGPLSVNIVWRLTGGMTLGLAWYLLIHHFLKAPWWSALFAVLLLADSGVLGCTLFARQAMNVLSYLSGKYERGSLPEHARLMGQWRLATPALTMAYLLAHLWLVSRARERPEDRARVVLAGISFGL